MEASNAATVQELIAAGRIVEAKTLLTMEEDSLGEEEKNRYHLAIDQRMAKAEALIAEAETLEQGGRNEEAKTLYLSVLAIAVDFPGIQDHIKRMDEALFLTKAVKHRSQRLRQSPSAKTRTTAPRLPIPLLGAGLATGLVLVFLVLLVVKPKPQPVPTPETAVIKTPVSQPVEQAVPPQPAPAQVPPPPDSTPVVAAESAAPPLPEPAQEEPVQAALPDDNTLQQIAQPPEPVPAASPGLADKEVYTVQLGDSLSRIAERLLCYEPAWPQIYARNRDQIADAWKLQPGMVLRLDGVENRCPKNR